MRRDVKILKLKRWHWSLIALAVGLLFAFNHNGVDIPLGVRSVSPQQFEFEVVQQPYFEEGQFVDDITVHPAMTGVNGEKTQLVTMARWTFDKLSRRWNATESAFEAPIPFAKDLENDNSRMSGAGTVMKFLQDARARRPSISYRYAWWEEPICIYCIAIAVSILLIAGIFPTLLQIVAAAGASSSNQAKPPTPSTTASSPVDEPAVTKTVEPEDVPTVTQLATEPLAADSPAGNEKIKRYSGEFYPVSVICKDSKQDK